MKHLQRFLPAFALLLAAAHASPIEYNFTGNLSLSGTPATVTGSFTFDSASQTVGAFSFSANGTFLFDNTMASTSGAALLDAGGNQALIFSQNLTGLSEAIVLDFAALPGPLNLAPFTLNGSSLTSGVYAITASGASEGAFTSGSASAVPEPPTLALLGGGLLLLGPLLCRRRAGAPLAG
jgi:hypothetical protein